jgi:alpha-tubulin suppressor-like RCC1 family protein
MKKTTVMTVVSMVTGLLWSGTPHASATPVAQISTGANHTCALTSAGAVKCWGRNLRGQLGDGTTADRTTPVAVSGLGSGIAVISAGYEHTCALTTGGGVKCWGANSGQLGDGTWMDSSTPVGVSGLGSGVAAISAGYDHTCALTTGGGVKCWGVNYGELGDGTYFDSNIPVDVIGLGSGVAAISGGTHHTCALTTAGSALCWGANFYGEIGDGTTTPRATPVGVSSLGSDVAAISSGGYHTCAIKTGGAIKCWGRNIAGELGNGTTTDSSTPVSVSGLGSGVASISAGFAHACALTTGGAMKCWGANVYGYLGDGTTTESATPVAVKGLGSGVASIFAGGLHTCALMIGGATKCWGYNRWGQVGDGTKRMRTTPVDVIGLMRAKTTLSMKAPATAAKGTSVEVSGTLSSALEACQKGQTLTLVRDGREKATTKTKASGRYRFSLQVKKSATARNTVVQVTFKQTAGCKASTSAKKTIRLRP